MSTVNNTLIYTDGDDTYRYTFLIYRACWYEAPTGQQTVLTGVEHRELPEAEMIEEAVREAYRANLVGEYPCLTEEQLRQGLKIGDWHAGAKA